jgi:hypothetical protein
MRHHVLAGRHVHPIRLDDGQLTGGSRGGCFLARSLTGARRVRLRDLDATGCEQNDNR